MRNQAKTLIVFFNLKPGTSEAEYLAWARQVDLPTVNKLQSVNSFEVFKGLNILGQQSASPWHYFEVIHITSEAEFLQEIQGKEMQQVISQFQAFTSDAHFICTQDVTTL
ncbi:hypothetical protein EHS17_15370 [Rhodobacteraceae bacterium CH30]|nr:hypothetical protein EHS17_15370 [Rhodobacteraceae bacterium CH30]